MTEDRMTAGDKDCRIFFFSDDPEGTGKGCLHNLEFEINDHGTASFGYRNVNRPDAKTSLCGWIRRTRLPDRSDILRADPFLDMVMRKEGGRS